MLAEDAPGVVEATVLTWNYLRGVRVITYGFGANAKPAGERPLTFLERLAATHHGWYRAVTSG